MNKNVEADDDSGWNAYFSLLCNINGETKKITGCWQLEFCVCMKVTKSELSEFLCVCDFSMYISLYFL